MILKIPFGFVHRTIDALILVELSLLFADFIIWAFRKASGRILILVTEILLLFIFNLLLSVLVARAYEEINSSEDDIFWRVLFPFAQVIDVSSLMYLIISYSINYKKEKEARIEAERREQDIKTSCIIDRLDNLMLQSDHHFVFNSLSTLVSLIRQNPIQAEELAKRFTMMFRYLLSSNSKRFVPITAELEFIKDYMEVLRIRHPEIEVKIHDGKLTDREFYVLPAAIQMLINNAVKHNAHCLERKLKITITAENDWVIVKNNILPLFSKYESTGIGLKNLSERYILLLHKNIRIDRTSETFTVYLPIAYMEDIIDEYIDN